MIHLDEREAELVHGRLLGHRGEDPNRWAAIEAIRWRIQEAIRARNAAKLRAIAGKSPVGGAA